MSSTEFNRTTTRFTKNPQLPPNLLTGTVSSVNVNSFTVTVVTGDNSLHSNVPVLDVYGTYMNQDVTWLKSLSGTNVLLVYLFDRYYVLAVIPFEIVDASKREDRVGDERLEFPSGSGVDGGADSGSYGKLTYKNFSGRRPTDIFDGDKIIRAEGGAEVSLLRGGIARLRGGPLCQLILTKFKELGMLITRTFKHFTDFGEVEYTHNEEGRVGMHLKGGADYKQETHPKDPKWTVQAWIGDCPEDSEDTRLYLKVNDINLQNYVTVSFDIGGNISLDATKDEFKDIGRNSNIDIAKDRTITVGKNLLKDIKNNYTLNVGNNKDVSISGSYNGKVSSGYNLQVGGSCNIKAGGSVNIQGGSAVNIKGSVIKFN